MANIRFLLPETKAVWEQIDKAGRYTSNSNTFSDFLTMAICALSGERMEDQYMETVQRYTEGEKGKRGCDYLAAAFGELVNTMEITRKDILGDIFEGAITFGENGQFFTPEHICTLMSQISMNPETTGKLISDPCCGSGRTLLAAADVNRHNEFVGQDIDLRCVQMTTINLALRNLYGWVIWGNSLEDERNRVYRTGFDGTGFIKEVEIEKCPRPVREIIQKSVEGPQKQLSLF